MLARRSWKHLAIRMGAIAVWLALMAFPLPAAAQESLAAGTDAGLASLNSGRIPAQETPSSAAVGVDTILAWVVLLGLIVTLVFCLQRVFSYRERWLQAAPAGKQGRNWLVLLLLLLGLCIASYLSFAYLTDTEVVCGSFSGCNIVQESSFAFMLGVPVGLWGVMGYLALMLTWALGVFGAPGPLKSGRRDRLLALVRPALLALSLFAVAFSTYLTAL